MDSFDAFLRKEGKKPIKGKGTLTAKEAKNLSRSEKAADAKAYKSWKKSEGKK